MTLEDVTKRKPEPSAEQLTAEELVRQAREQGLSLTGPDGLLKQLTKAVLETALDQELTEHLGHEKNGTVVNETGNVRNGARPKTVLTEGNGHVQVDVPRDRDGTFEPQIIRKRQRRLGGVDEIVLSLYAKGLTTGEISAHFAEVYGASVSKETVSRITDKVIEEMQAWQARPLDEACAAIFIDAIMVKVRDGQVASRPVYAAIGVTLAGEKDILGLWAGQGGEGAKFWMSVLTDLRARLHGGERRGGQGRARRAHREMGPAVRRHHPPVGERLERVHPLPRLRRRDPQGLVLHRDPGFLGAALAQVVAVRVDQGRTVLGSAAQPSGLFRAVLAAPTRSSR
jgi:hypothetical protein